MTTNSFQTPLSEGQMKFKKNSKGVEPIFKKSAGKSNKVGENIKFSEGWMRFFNVHFATLSYHCNRHCCCSLV